MYIMGVGRENRRKKTLGPGQIVFTSATPSTKYNIDTRPTPKIQHKYTPHTHNMTQTHAPHPKHDKSTRHLTETGLPRPHRGAAARNPGHARRRVQDQRVGRQAGGAAAEGLGGPPALLCHQEDAGTFLRCFCWWSVYIHICISMMRARVRVDRRFTFWSSPFLLSDSQTHHPKHPYIYVTHVHTLKFAGGAPVRDPALRGGGGIRHPWVFGEEQGVYFYLCMYICV